MEPWPNSAHHPALDTGASYSSYPTVPGKKCDIYGVIIFSTDNLCGFYTTIPVYTNCYIIYQYNKRVNPGSQAGLLS